MSGNIVLEYDPHNPLSIERYAKLLIGKTFADVCNEDTVNAVITINDGYEEAHSDRKRKGGLGDLIEERYFHYECNCDSRPDFPDAGVELKVTPYRENKDGTLSAKERLIITMIDYFKVVEEPFESSHLWNKARLILLIYYLYRETIPDRLDYQIKFAQLFSPPEADLRIIKQDYEKIISKIKAGKAHELSESDTLYLGAVTKSADSTKRREQPFSNELAKPRAFSFKTSYMTYVLNNYIVPGKKMYEPIIKNDMLNDFEKYIIDKIDQYKGYTVSALCQLFDIEYKKPPKNLGAILAYKILGISGNNAEEFVKANIVTKIIRIENDNRIKESMSFPTFKFNELILENWEDSTFGNYLRETRFFFVVYKYNEEHELVLQGSQFWNMPNKDLEEVRTVWQRTIDVIVNNERRVDKSGKSYLKLPGSSENRVCHVRPHAQNANDTYPLPNGTEYTKQCFWLNNTYIFEQIDKRLLVPLLNKSTCYTDSNKFKEELSVSGGDDMASVKSLKKSFSKWLSSRNESQETIDEYISNLEIINHYYALLYDTDFDIWCVSEPKKLDAVLNVLTKKSFTSRYSRVYISKNSLLMLKKYIFELNCKNDSTHIYWRTQSVVDNEIDYKKKLNEVTKYLTDKYKDKPAHTLSQLIKDNEGVINFSYFGIWTNKIFGMTAGQYLIKKGVLYPQDNPTLSKKEQLLTIVDALRKKYDEKPAHSYSQVVNENKNLKISRINQWTQDLYGQTAKQYLTIIGIIDDYSILSKNKSSQGTKNYIIVSGTLTNNTSRNAISARVLTLDEKTFLLSCLQDGFCILDDLRIKYAEKFPSNNSPERVNDATLSGLAFRVYSNFVISNKYRSAKEYFSQKLLDNDLSDLNQWDSRVADCQVVRQVIDELTSEYDLLEFDKKKYMTFEHFSNVMPNFKRKDFYHYLNCVSDCVNKDEYFTFKLLVDRGLKSPFHELGFSEWFPASIIKNSHEYRYIRIGGTFLFYKGNRNKTKTDFFKSLLLELYSIEIDDFIDLLRNDYGILMNRNNIIHAVKDSSIYFDSIMDKLYYKKEYYYDEIK